jgi:hypothetical protein
VRLDWKLLNLATRGRSTCPIPSRGRCSAFRAYDTHRQAGAGRKIVRLLRRMLDEMGGSLFGSIALGKKQLGDGRKLPNATLRFASIVRR